MHRIAHWLLHFTFDHYTFNVSPTNKVSKKLLMHGYKYGHMITRRRARCTRAWFRAIWCNATPWTFYHDNCWKYGRVIVRVTCAFCAPALNAKPAYCSPSSDLNGRGGEGFVECCKFNKVKEGQNPWLSEAVQHLVIKRIISAIILFLGQAPVL